MSKTHDDLRALHDADQTAQNVIDLAREVAVYVRTLERHGVSGEVIVALAEHVQMVRMEQRGLVELEPERGV